MHLSSLMTVLVHSLIHFSACGCGLVLRGAELGEAALATAHRGRDERDRRPCPIKHHIAIIIPVLVTALIGS